MSDVHAWMRAVVHNLRVEFTRGADPENAASTGVEVCAGVTVTARRARQQPPVGQRDRELAAAYGVHGTPCAMVVGPEHDLRDGPAYGAERSGT